MPETSSSKDTNKRPPRQQSEKHLRRMSWLYLAFLVPGLVALIWVLDNRMNDIPAIGRTLDPRGGLWARPVPIFENEKTPTELKIPGLTGKVEIQVDRDQIKHIFAENDRDLYMAQGFVIASERLWQMEFLTRLAAGRLSEIFGRRTLEIDKLFIKLGIPEAARKSAELAEQDPASVAAIQAYTDGVNAWIKGLTPDKLPFEYKLLGQEPELWNIYKVGLLLKFMAWNLSAHSYDLPLSRSQGKLHPQDFAELFALSFEPPEPIIPRGTKWDFASRAPEAPKEPFESDLRKLDPILSPHPANGSNNWAVMGKKSTTGLPIVSNDIHLGLHLPSLWYEIQLKSPNQNVYGVALPGAPGIVLGFNDKLAWGGTNGGTDILDWYELRYRDEKKSEYLFDGQWRPVVSQDVEIKIRGEPSLTLLTRQTHLGPIVYDESESPYNPLIPKGLAMRWAALDPSNELKVFLAINRAKTVSECRAAIQNFDTPDQNFLCADSTGDVGMWHMGKYPVRWPGQGRTISDGSKSAWEWKGWIPREEVPGIKNPARGFVSSANQPPADGLYPHYLGWPFETPYRGMRINEILTSKAKFSPEDLVKMQGDVLSIPAREVLPKLLEALAKSPPDESVKPFVELLKKWDFRYTEESVAATIYHRWYQKLVTAMWSPYLPDSVEYLYPTMQKTLELITAHPDSKWFDDPNTPGRETLNERALSAFTKAVDSLESELGSFSEKNWAWATARPTSFTHIGRVPGLGQTDFPAAGSEHTIFANHGAHGPAWKVVVALGPKPKAWGIYPGGQSGDPTSPFYDNFLEPWRKNEMKEIVFLQKPDDENPRLLRRHTMSAGPLVGEKR